MVVTKEVEIGGKIISIETGKYAKQANGSVMVRYGDTMVLVTAVAAEEPKPLLYFYHKLASASFREIENFINRKATLGFFIGQPQQHNNTKPENQVLTKINCAQLRAHK